MRKLYFLLVAFFFFNSTLFGQDWKRMQSWGLDFESITWVNGSLGFIGGENILIKTEDGGQTWQELNIPENTLINDLAFWDESIGFAIGDEGTILKTINGGLEWTKINSPTSNHLYSILVVDENSILLVGESGLIFQSKNHGESWEAIDSPVKDALRDIFFIDEDTGYISGDGGIILKTENGGADFELLNSSSTVNMNSISFSSELIGYAAGSSGVILKTEDGGQNWRNLNSGVTTELKKIVPSPVDSRIILVVGESATALKSSNSGTSFSKINLGTGNSRNLNDLSFMPESNQIMAVGENGYLIKSINAGNNYSTILAGYKTHFSSVDFKTEKYGFIAGQNGSFYVTSNGATSLISRPLPEQTDINSIDFWSTAYGFASSNSGKIYRTGNGGSSWVSVPAQTEEDITGFYLFAPSVLYITGSNGYIARSFDSGATWDANISTNTTENLKDVTYFDYQYGFAMGDNGQISWTNGGNTWENLPKLTDQNLNALAKPDSSTSIIVGDGGVILKSDDIAKTWRIIPTEITENLNSVDFWDENLGIVAGDNGVTLQTKDGGETWLRIETGTTRNLNSISMATSLVAYAAGDDGTILNYICSTPSGISDILGESTVCLGPSVYEVEDTNLPGSQIVWRVDGGEIISGQGTTSISVNWNKTGRQGVFVSRQNFCGNGETSSLEVLVNHLPTMENDIAGNGSVCTDQIEIYSLPTLSGVTYTWTAEGGEISSGQGSSEIEVIWLSKGVHNLSVVLENSCGKSLPIEKVISADSPPDQPYEIRGESQLGLGEAYYEVEFQEGVNYLWEISENGGTIISGQGTSSIIIDWQIEGDFTVKVTPQNQCNEGISQMLEVNVNIITGIEPDLDLTLSIFPNPSEGSLTISSDNLSEYQEISLINSLGQILLHSQIVEGQKEIHFSELPKGMILIQLSNQKKSVTKKIMVK